MGNPLKLKQLQTKIKELKLHIDSPDFDAKLYKSELSLVLTEVEVIVQGSHDFFLTSSKVELKSTLSTVLEAYITSPYADNCEERTNAVVLFKNIDRLII